MGGIVVEKLDELLSLDPEQHWLCPRSPALDELSFFDEDVLDILPTEDGAAQILRRKRLEEAGKRQDLLLEAIKIFAFEGPDAKPYQDKSAEALKVQLTRCDVCVRQYHRSRSILLERLEQEFESDEIRGFMEKFDEMNISRIKEGLNGMTESLTDLPPDQRNILSAGDAAMYALFEALNCVPFLNSQDTLRDFFDRPFRLVQTKKRLKLNSYAPGMVAFLFSENSERFSWALRNFSSVKRPLTSTEFQYSVKPFWENAMARVDISFLNAEFLPLFWTASRTIIKKLTRDVVVDQLRAMNVNLYTLGLEHFQLDLSQFDNLLASYQDLLEMNPTAFWEAFGSISPQAVTETILRSPILDRALAKKEEDEAFQLSEKLKFTLQFIETIQPQNLVSPACFILDMLLHKLQNEHYSEHARSVCWETGMACMLRALEIMNGQIKGGPIAAHMQQQIASNHFELVTRDLSGIEGKTEMSIDNSIVNRLSIVQQAVQLEISGLAYDRSSIVRSKAAEHKIDFKKLEIWKMCVQILRPGHPSLPAAILSGSSDLLPLEKFTERQINSSPKSAKDWNAVLDSILAVVSSDFLERLETFTQEQLIELFEDPHAANGLIALLFNGDDRVHQATLSILKGLSNEDTRRDSLKTVLGKFTSRVLAATSKALSGIIENKSFNACRVALKLCTDILSCLCDSHDGILRSRSLSSGEINVLEKFWTRSWQLLGMVFERMESWSLNDGHDKDTMKNFCREAMDFATFSFEQYPILTSSLKDAGDQSESDLRKALLEHPRTKFTSLSKWLRLRDEYLVSNAVSLTRKILGRLHDVDILVEKDAAQYVQDIVSSGDRNAKVRTNLSRAQKAELQRALEQHLGDHLSEFIDIDTPPPPKSQSTLQQWASSGRSSGASTPSSGPTKSTQGAIDVGAWTKAAERNKRPDFDGDTELKKLLGSMDASERYKATMGKRQQQPSTVQQRKHILPVTARPAPKPKDSNDFLAKRQKEKDEADKRRAMALAKAKGVPLAGASGLDSDDTPKGENVMVSSSEESEDDEDDMDIDLFGPSKKGPRKVNIPNVDPNGAIGLKPEQKSGPTRIKRTARSHKDMRARLAPDLTSLHKTILRWDFFHQGDYPPGENEYRFRAVAKNFSDPVTYQQTFEPLLTLEAWQGMVKSREENSNKAYEIKIQSRSNIDSFLEISSLLSNLENRDLSLSEGDIVLLSKAQKPADDPSSPHCLARIHRLKRRGGQLEVVYQVMSGTPLALSLVQQAVVHGLKIQSITPLEREYGALQALQYYDLCTQITRAQPSKRMEFSDKQLAAYQDVWNVNRAQSEAINAAMENEGFSLIQGPPGSGKTKTIVAIVGGLLSSVLGSSTTGTKISVPKPHGNANNGLAAVPRKLLVCAPSNAAVDEIVMRLKEGVITKSGRRHELNVVRIGRSEAINAQVVDVTMEELVSKRLGTGDNDQKLRERNAELFKEHEKISKSLRELYQKKDAGSLSAQELNDLNENIVAVRKRKNELGVRIDNAKDTEQKAGRDAELNRKKAQQAVLDEAHVICATLSGSGHDMFQSLNIEFETVIIDEAAQCVEMSSLIPLKYGCVKCIMVGDPKQLPPTVFSREAARFAYEQSLFVRMQNNSPKDVHLLDTQYRMHPEISTFPSRAFYDSLLKDGKGMAGLRQRPWHASALLSPYRFFDVAGQHQSAPKGHSLINLAEIDVAMALFQRLTKDFSDYEYNGRIGIITPYKSQLRALKDRFQARFGHEVFDIIEFNTTDAFQGRESEIIIFSCVRASPAGGIGFLQDIRRMNVGLTRAKSSLWVLGNSDSLSRGEWWKKLVDDARARDSYTTGDLLAMLENPSSAFPAQMDKNVAMQDVSAQAKIKPEIDEPKPAKVSRQATGKPIKTEQRGSDGAQATKQPSVPRTVTPKQDPDRMEGVTYPFEDRVAKTKAAPSARPKLSTAAVKHEEPVDVDMANGEDTASHRATSTTSGSSTPKAEASADNMGKEVPKNRAPLVNPQPVPQRLTKRAAPSPFLPRKQQRPR